MLIGIHSVAWGDVNAQIQLPHHNILCTVITACIKWETVRI